MPKTTPAPEGAPVSHGDVLPWMGILKWCLALTVPAVLIAAVIGFVVAGVPGLVSTLAAAGVVVLFFAISLVVGHFVGHLAPKALLGAFALTYLIKVIGFGAFLLVPTDPSWFSRTWATVGAVLALIVWQGTEMYRFSQLRLRVFDDPQAPTTTRKEGS